MAPTAPPSSIPPDSQSAASRRRITDIVADVTTHAKTRTAAFSDEERAIALRNIARVLVGRDLFDELGLNFRDLELVEVVGADDDGDDEDDGTPRKRKRAGGTRQVALINISQDGSQDSLAVLEKAFSLALRSTALTIQQGNKSVTRSIRPKEANAIAYTFFHTMLSTVPARARQLIAEQGAMLIEQQADDVITDPDAPPLVKQLAAGVQQCYSMQASTVRNGILRNSYLVRVVNAWSELQTTLDDNSQQGAEALQYILSKADLPAARINGQKRRDQAAEGLSAMLRIDKKDFADLCRDGAMPAALVNHLGHGALMLLPPSKTNLRSKIQYTSAAQQMVGILVDTDTDGIIQAFCEDMEKYFVMPVIEGTTVEWDYSGPVDTLFPDFTQDGNVFLDVIEKFYPGDVDKEIDTIVV